MNSLRPSLKKSNHLKPCSRRTASCDLTRTIIPSPDVALGSSGPIGFCPSSSGQFHNSGTPTSLYCLGDVSKNLSHFDRINVTAKGEFPVGGESCREFEVSLSPNLFPTDGSRFSYEARSVSFNVADSSPKASATFHFCHQPKIDSPSTPLVFYVQGERENHVSCGISEDSCKDSCKVNCLNSNEIFEIPKDSSGSSRIHKRLSFGDTLDLHTNVYTPADESSLVSHGDRNGVPTQANGVDGSLCSLEKRIHEDDVLMPPLVRRNSMDSQSQYSYYMDNDIRYYFQHPWLRLIVAYLVIFCNFLLFVEDPVSHSHTESNIAVVGNVFSFVATKYPDEWYWRAVKVIMWLIAICCGMLVGKILVHGIILKKLLRLKMFRDEQGSWMSMSVTTIVSLYMFSHVYNLVLLIGHEDHCKWAVESAMGFTNESMMKAAATCTWLGDLVTALMVTDMMLQDNLYPGWATRFRAIYRLSNVPRILIFWVGSILVATVVIFLIVSDYITWDQLNEGFVETTELSRAFLASFILVMDLLIVMQDWDFPHFTATIDVNLPGFSTHTLRWAYGRVSMTGKWFNYGIIFFVMMFDLNMWKNQIFYRPEVYGQYIDPVSRKVYTVEDDVVLNTTNASLWTWEARGELDPRTGHPFREKDMFMYSRFMDYEMEVKFTAFIPNILGFVMLFTLVTLYGRFPPNYDGTYGGRLKIRKRSSWRRERRSIREHRSRKESENSVGCRKESENSVGCRKESENSVGCRKESETKL